MSHINYALDRINREIPAPVLAAAYGSSARVQRHTTQDEIIRQRVIHRIVNEDTNIVAGQVVTLRIDEAIWRTDQVGHLIEIPMSMTSGRPINSLLGLEYNYAGSVGGDYINPGSTGSSDCYLIPPRTIYIPNTIVSTVVGARVLLGNNEQLSNLPARTKMVYGDLCVLAAKADIYNTLAIGINTYNMNESSVDSRLREIVNSYSDSRELYMELLNGRWTKVHILSDREYHSRYIKAQFS